MSTNLLTELELTELISYLNQVPNLPPTLVNVTSKLAASLPSARAKPFRPHVNHNVEILPWHPSYLEATSDLDHSSWSLNPPSSSSFTSLSHVAASSYGGESGDSSTSESLRKTRSMDFPSVDHARAPPVHELTGDGLAASVIEQTPATKANESARTNLSKKMSETPHLTDRSLRLNSRMPMHYNYMRLANKRKRSRNDHGLEESSEESSDLETEGEDGHKRHKGFPNTYVPQHQYHSKHPSKNQGSNIGEMQQAHSKINADASLTPHRRLLISKMLQAFVAAPNSDSITARNLDYSHLNSLDTGAGPGNSHNGNHHNTPGEERHQLRLRGSGGGGVGGGEPLPKKICKRGGASKRARAIYRQARRQRRMIYSDEEEEAEEEVQVEDVFEPAHHIQNAEDRYEQEGSSVPDRLALNDIAQHFLLQLAHACWHISTGDLGLYVSEVLEAIHGRIESNVSSVMATDSLESLAERCIMADRSMMTIDFVHMLNCIQLRSKVISICESKNETATTVLRSIKCSKSIYTLRRYLQDGARYSTLANAGTVFLLVALAVAKLKACLRDKELSSDVLMKLNHIIRCPDPTSTQGQLVINQIIPAIAIMRTRYRVEFNTMFSQPFLHRHHIVAKVEIGDLKVSDDFFDSILFNTFLKKRCQTSWSPCYTELPSEISPLPYYIVTREVLSSVPSSVQFLPQIEIPKFTTPLTSLPSPMSDNDGNFEIIPEAIFPAPPVFSINTDFNPKHDTNVKVNFRSSERDRYSDTQIERKRAKKAKVPTSLDDLRLKLWRLLVKGYKHNPNVYVSIPTDILQNKRVMIRDANNDPMIIIIPDMPDDLKERAKHYLKMAFPGKLQYTDSEVPQNNHSFESIQFSWYNRYSKRGDNIPADVEPAAHQRPGRKKIAMSRCQPRTSEELQDHMEEYKLLEDCFSDIFKWISTAIKQLLPEEYDTLAQFAEVLPAGGFAPAYPFSGFIINFNVSTKLHRDWNDNKFCLVMVISENCEGGDICFVEPGIRLQLQHGQLVLFHSRQLSHFNMHFTGFRSSIVFHSDSAGEAWVKDRNGWDKTIHMNISNRGGGIL